MQNDKLNLNHIVWQTSPENLFHNECDIIVHFVLKPINATDENNICSLPEQYLLLA